MKQWPVVQGEGLDSIGSPLSLSRLKNLGGGVCTFYKTRPTYPSAVTALRWSLFGFPFLPSKLRIAHSIPSRGCHGFLLSLCLRIPSSPVSPHKQASPLPSARDFSFALVVSPGCLAPLIFRYAYQEARHSPARTESLVFLSLLQLILFTLRPRF